MPKYQLGQRVKYHGYMYREKTYREGKWVRSACPGEGIVAGIRTVSDGESSYDREWGTTYKATKYHSFWLVAHNLASYRHVAEEDMELCKNQST